jgi:hypothetical protein
MTTNTALPKPASVSRRAGEARPRYLRVVTLEDGETVHNAFFDRNFREDVP